MKNIYYLICIVFIVFSCKKEEITEVPKPDFYWGQGEALMNDNPWLVDAVAALNINHGNGFELFMDSLVSNSAKANTIKDTIYSWHLSCNKYKTSN